MDRFIFTDDLLTGEDDIDAQHRQLFHLANLVAECEAKKGAGSELIATVAYLSDYVNFHFAAEEFAMNRSCFPGRTQHSLAHEVFRNSIGEIVTLALESANVAELRPRLIDAISGWLTAHIMDTDRALAGHLRKHALDGIGDWPNADELLTAGAIDAKAHAAGAAATKS
jgi:hemerythrin